MSLQLMAAQQAVQYARCEDLTDLDNQIRERGGTTHSVAGLPGTYYLWADVTAVRDQRTLGHKAPSQPAKTAGTRKKAATRTRASQAPVTTSQPATRATKGGQGTGRDRPASKRVPAKPRGTGGQSSATVVELPGIKPYPDDPEAKVGALACRPKHELIVMATEYGLKRSGLPYQRKDIARLIVDLMVKRWNEREIAKTGHTVDELAVRRTARGANRTEKLAPVIKFSDGAK